MKGVRLALRLSRGAGRHERVRSLVMIVGVALATLGLAVGVTLPRVTAQQQEVRDARTPILAPDEPADGHTGFKVQELQVDGTPWTSFVVNHPADRLPPGLKHWPQPGHTIVSPRLKSLMDAGVVKISSLGTIDPVAVDRAALASPDELFSITTTSDQAGCRELKAFGLTRIGDSGVSSRTVWIEVIGLVALPAAVLLWTSLSLSAASRRDRFMTLVRMGCDPDWCGQVFAVEVSGTAGLGALLGLALFIPVQNALGSSGTLGLTWWPWQARLRWPEWLIIVVIMVIASGWLARRALRRLLASRRPPAPPCPAWDSASSARDRWSSPRGGCDRSGGLDLPDDGTRPQRPAPGGPRRWIHHGRSGAWNSRRRHVSPPHHRMVCRP